MVLSLLVHVLVVVVSYCCFEPACSMLQIGRQSVPSLLPSLLFVCHRIMFCRSHGRCGNQSA